jgi:hypothetical protein
VSEWQSGKSQNGVDLLELHKGKVAITKIERDEDVTAPI